MRAIAVLFALGVASCAHTPPQSGETDANGCSVAEAEPVSQCRAQYACGRGSAWLFFGTLFGGIGAGLTGKDNQAVVNYQTCIDREMRAQELNRAH